MIVNGHQRLPQNGSLSHSTRYHLFQAIHCLFLHVADHHQESSCHHANTSSCPLISLCVPVRFVFSTQLVSHSSFHMLWTCSTCSFILFLHVIKYFIINSIDYLNNIDNTLQNVIFSEKIFLRVWNQGKKKGVGQENLFLKFEPKEVVQKSKN